MIILYFHVKYINFIVYSSVTIKSIFTFSFKHLNWNMAEVTIPIVNQDEIELEELPIGRGGYGTVYRGKHRQFGHVAVKTLINNGQLPKK